MEQTKTNIFFLGANTSRGFFSCFDQLIDLKTATHLYIIKGGPGTGKSSFMRKAAQMCEAAQHPVHYIPCASDPSSLDAISCPDLGIAFVDGTAPHTLDPQFPGAVDSILDLGQFWDRAQLTAHKSEIIDQTAAYKSYFSMAYRYLAAAGSMHRAVFAPLQSALLADKLSAFFTRFRRDRLPTPIQPAAAFEKRFLSSPGPDGYTSFALQLAGRCRESVVINNTSGTAPLLLEHWESDLRDAGYRLIIYLDPLDPEGPPEALELPEAHLCMINGSLLPDHSGKLLNPLRFFEREKIRQHQAKARFCKKAKQMLLQEGMQCLRIAREEHGKLEEIYRIAMDFPALDRFAEHLPVLLGLSK